MTCIALNPVDFCESQLVDTPDGLILTCKLWTAVNIGIPLFLKVIMTTAIDWGLRSYTDITLNTRLH